jgi:AraC-like DNA-binding protein
MKLFLRFMSDHRFKVLLQAELGSIGESHDIAELEDAQLAIPPDVKYKVMHSALVRYAGEVSNTREGLLLAQIKTTISEALEGNTDGPPYIRYAVYLSDKLHHSYPYLSAIFSHMNGSTLENYIISQRIELVKHMLVDKGLGLSEIVWKLGYCSVAHLSNQFKKITGSTPTGYKRMVQEDAISLGILCEPCKQRWMALSKG